MPVCATPRNDRKLGSGYKQNQNAMRRINANLGSCRFINETPDSCYYASVHHTESIVPPHRDIVKQKSVKFTDGGQIPIDRPLRCCTIRLSKLGIVR